MVSTVPVALQDMWLSVGRTKFRRPWGPPHAEAIRISGAAFISAF